jgi:membrane-associated phospholipid phosphatase
MPPSTSTTSGRSPWTWAATCAAGFALLLLAVALGLTDAVDAALISALGVPAPSELLDPLLAVTNMGSSWAIVTVGALALLAGWAAHRPRDGALGAVVIAIGALVIELVKRVIGRQRPEVLEPILVEVGYSFPSGHTANATIAYGVLAVLIGRVGLPAPVRVTVWLMLAGIVVAVGLSRIWLGVHYPSDVVGGWLLGATFVASYAALTRRGSPASASAAVAEDPAGPRSDRPAAG